MIAESNYAVVIATFGNRLKNLAPIFQLIKEKPKPSASLRTLIKLHVTAKNSD